MKLSDFMYELPSNRIAQAPVEPRDASEIIIFKRATQSLEQKKFFEIASQLTSNDVLVINTTRVIPARLFGEMDIFPNGKKQIKHVEIFLHKQISQDTWECLGYPGKNLKVGRQIRFYDEKRNLLMTGDIQEVSSMGRFIQFHTGEKEFFQVLQELGEIPLPPYITESLADIERYQTVFGKQRGSAAAPTAGLHFTQELIEKLTAQGVIFEEVLLHVGVGTFKPVETENIQDHQMHSEYIELSDEVAHRLNSYKKQGKRIIAVGTTSVRVLESFASAEGILTSGKKETSIFIYPGYNWKFVDSIITNFHLPGSTLLMLVSSFAGIHNTQAIYQYALDHNLRFFSFGDAMWIQ